MRYEIKWPSVDDQTYMHFRGALVSLMAHWSKSDVHGGMRTMIVTSTLEKSCITSAIWAR